jgi:uncharacterized membrane protein
MSAFTFTSTATLTYSAACLSSHISTSNAIEPMWQISRLFFFFISQNLSNISILAFLSIQLSFVQPTEYTQVVAVTTAALLSPAGEAPQPTGC